MTAETTEELSVAVRTGKGPKPLTDDDREHREDFREFAVSKSDERYRPTMRRLYDLWDSYTQWLDAPMTAPYILLGPPAFSHALGEYAPVSSFGGRSEIRIRETLLNGKHPSVMPEPKFAEGRFLFVADVLLHETIHQYQREASGQTEESYSGHGPHFRDMANKVGAMLGLPPVRAGKARGKDKSLPSCSHWPHCVRPPEYYQGAYIPPDEREDDVPESKSIIVNPDSVSPLPPALVGPVVEAIEKVFVDGRGSLDDARRAWLNLGAWLTEKDAKWVLEACDAMMPWVQEETKRQRASKRTKKSATVGT